MNLLELLYDFFCGVSDLLPNYSYNKNSEYSLLYNYMQKEDLASYDDEVREMIEKNIMTREDFEILEKRIQRLSIDLDRLLKRAERFHWSATKLDSELRILLSKYKFSKNYINHFANHFIEIYKQEHK